MDRRTFLALAVATVSTAGCTGEPPVDPRPTSSAPLGDDPDARIRERVAESESALIAAYRAALVTAPALGDLLTPLLRHHEEHLRLVAPGSTGLSGVPTPSATAGSAQASAPVGSPEAVGTATPTDATPTDGTLTDETPTAATPTAASSLSPDATVDPTAAQPGTSGGPESGGGTAEPTSDASGGAPAGTIVTTLESLAAAESAAREQRIAACDGAADPALARLLCLVAASEAQHAAVLVLAGEEAS